MKIIGVTGGIGSGKSSVSRILRDLGAAVVDADVIAKNVISSSGKAFDELVAYFGTDIVAENGEIDRSKLAEKAFGNKVMLHALNSITHKYVAEKLKDTVELLKGAGKWDVIVLDVPIPVQQGFIDLVDEIWVVIAERETRIRRVMERSGFTYDEVTRRMDSQLSDDEYLRLAGEVIRNDGSMEELEQAVVKLFLSKKQEWQR